MINYIAALQKLYQRRWLGLKLGLYNVKRLCDLVGNPQKQLRFIHVAGTNGKGSTCVMLESIYRHAGHRVGLYLSPHLTTFQERIQINRYPIPRDKVIEYVERLEKVIQQEEGFYPTFFEVVTVMAMLYFVEEGVDLVIWETGMGGRLDATNIVRPLLSVITTIGFDHMQWLGSTLKEIVSEKAGIIKQGRPVVTGVTDPEALDVIWEQARFKGSALYVVEPSVAAHYPWNSLHLSLKGSYQRHNAAVAGTVAQILKHEIPVAEADIILGLEEAFLMGRFQMIKREKQLLVLDGAHNPSAAAVLRQSLEEEFPNVKWLVIATCLADKDWRGIWRQLSQIALELWIVGIKNSRVADLQLLENIAIEESPSMRIEKFASIKEALDKSSSYPYCLITGSLYLVGETLKVLGFSPEPDPELDSDWVAIRQNR